MSCESEQRKYDHAKQRHDQIVKEQAEYANNNKGKLKSSRTNYFYHEEYKRLKDMNDALMDLNGCLGLQ